MQLGKCVTHSCTVSEFQFDSRSVTCRRRRRHFVSPYNAVAGGSDSADHTDIATKTTRRTALFCGAATPIISQTLTLTQPSSSFAAALPNLEASTSAIPKVQLANDLQISQIIKGCWQLSGGHRGEPSSDRTSGAAAVEDFAKFSQAGITTFDTADIYGPSEELIGKYLANTPGALGSTQVLTKCCFFGLFQQKGKSLSAVREHVVDSQKRLGVDKLDLVQMYWNEYNVKQYVDAALNLMELQASGVIGHLGVTNFDIIRIQQMADAGVKLVSNQVQYSLLDRRPEQYTVPYCLDNNIKLLPFGVLAGGFLSEKYLGLPVNKVVINTYSKSKYGRIIQETGGWDWFQALLVVLDSIARKHGVTISTVAARWVLDKPVVAGIIVGARNTNHVDEYRQVFELVLDAEDMAAVSSVLDNGVQPTGDVYDWERGGAW